MTSMLGPEFAIASRRVGTNQTPLVVAEIGINHEGDSGQGRIAWSTPPSTPGRSASSTRRHVVEDEMIPQAKTVIPGNATSPSTRSMERCALSEEDERRLMDHATERGAIFISTPFSRAAADRLAELRRARATRSASGECNNYPLVRHIARLGKPVIVCTGMNSLDSIRPTSRSCARCRGPLRAAALHDALSHAARVGAPGRHAGVRDAFPDAVMGLSDHTTTIYPCLGAVALGASASWSATSPWTWAWPGPDILVSMDPAELAELIEGSRLIHTALGGTKDVLAAEQPTIDFAYASVVTTADIAPGEPFTDEISGSNARARARSRRRTTSPCWAAAQAGPRIGWQVAWSDIAGE